MRRRWRLLNRFFRPDNDPLAWDRCLLVVEQLEEREVPAPLVFSPEFAGIPQINEGSAYFFNYTEAFFIGEDSEGSSGHTFRARLTGVHGRVSVNASAAAETGVSVAGNGTATVILTGPLDGINSVFSSGISLTPTAYYSGDASVNLRAADLATGEFDTGSATIQVRPLASDVVFNVNASGEVYAPSSGFAFGAGFIKLANWPDNDGSERITVTFSLDAPNPAAFKLSTGGMTIAPVEDGLWQLSGTIPANFRALLNSLVLTPPAGFTGRATLSVFANINDSASFPSNGTNASDGHFLGSADVPLRFFVGGTVTLPTAFGFEGGTIDLGGRYVASDPDELPGDIHTLAISVPNGTLTLNTAAVPEGVSASSTVGSDGSTTIVLMGAISGIDQFLATAGCMTYTAASPTFAGLVPLTFVLKNQPGPFFGQGQAALMVQSASAGQSTPGAFTGVAALAFVPTADHAHPFATNVTTDEDTPVALFVSVSGIADTDGSETVLVVLGNVPTGATFNRGSNLGGGQWAFSLADLVGLTFTPPEGETGVFSMTVTAAVTNTGSGVSSASYAESTAFTVTVNESDDDDSTSPDEAEAAGEADNDGSTPESSEITEREGHDEGAGGGHGDSHGPGQPAFAGNTGGSGGPGRPGGPEAGRPRFGGQQVNSPFPQGEAPQPLYAGGEKHPLPPVLPLDQSLPGAGFSDSGGDSFALIDMIYRGAGQPASDAATGAQTAQPVVAVADAPGQTETTATAAAAPVAAAPPNDPGSAEPPAKAAQGEWRLWAAGIAIIGSLAAWAWFARGSNWFPTRAARRLLRALHRRPTERAA